MEEQKQQSEDIVESIVGYLKSLLDMSFTLFQFSELSGRDLLDLLNTIFHAISDTQPEKIGTEKIEATVDRMSEFLRIMKYEFPVEPEEWDVRFANADKDLIYPVMHWLLSDFEGMKKRAYKAKFAEEVPIPEEIKVDQTVSELIGQLNELQERFETTLAEYEEVGSTNVEELKKTQSNLEADKARLATKVSGFKRKLSKVPNLDEMLKWTRKLREANDRELSLSEELQKLIIAKRNLEKRQQAAEDDIKNVKKHMEEKLVFLKNELASLQNAGKNTTDDKGIAIPQQQVAAARKRLEQKKRQLSDMKKAHQEAEEQLAQKQQDGAIEVPSPTQFAAYVRELKSKNENYKQFQANLATFRKELAIMMRTEEIVTQQYEKTQHEISRIEHERGVGGFREARAQLEKVSATKADLDDMKGKTLEEMSSISKEIQRSIQARQTELKPLVSALQDTRKKKAAIESKYLQSKQRYQNAVSEYDSVCMELDEESKKIRNEIGTYQSKYHNVLQMLNNQQRIMKRVREEQDATETGNPVSKDIKTYSNYFQKAARDLKKQTQDLKEQKKTIGSETESNQKQLEMFQSLRRLLQVKLECTKIAKQKKEDELKRDENERRNPDEIIVL
ncbi:Intraflagellar transport protein 81 [Tritrichomonas musculus]|uniref:Intraflagellar transport protein 81 n=1 Tax=Tritrichomonas musculus TaxID=1915356 RepID=A0ABR2JLZ7_9EUKA